MTDPLDIQSDTAGDTPPRAGMRVPAVAWLGTLFFLLSAAAVTLMIWVPNLQQKRAVGEVERLGGRVYRGPGPRNWWGRLLGELSGEADGPVVVVDLSAAHLTDESAAVIRAFPSAEMVSLGGPELTDASLDHLAELSSLRRVILVNCPHVTEVGIDGLIREQPGLEVSRRGPALLGVMGQRHVLGCLVLEVRPDTAAARGGLLAGDIVTKIANRRIGGFEGLAREVGRHQPGKEVSVTVLRKGRELELPVTLGRWQ